MSALTKADLVEKLMSALGAETLGNRVDAKSIVDSFFEEIRVALEANEAVKLSGFGNFELRDKKQRPGRNPKTGEEVSVTARRVVTLRPGQKLKRRIDVAMRNVKPADVKK